ncbi:MAG: peptidoglycan DD-metalloendopeptidase family protein [Nitriliruptorales bacterium]|nr:peptidoglycan DD-metalloendopeptidase family protein [Nitriliruptorales bacterium]
MSSPLRRSRVLALLLAALVSLPVAAEGQDLDTVERELDQLEDEVGQATAAYEDVWARVNQTEADLAQLSERRAELAAQLEESTAALRARARAMFMQGPDSMLISLLAAEGPQRAMERASLMSILSARDRADIEAAGALRTQLSQTEQLLEDRSAELEALREQLQQNKERLEAELQTTRVLAEDLRRREARKRRIQRGVQQGTYACIFDPGTFRFRDTWGAPRSGGRRHKGTDVFSYWDSPVFAFTTGRIHRISRSRLGGLGLYLYGDDGNLYYYAHLNRIADATYVGKRVEAGEHIAYNGDSGNARGGPPHVHFELHPGGGGAINPYPWLAAACY